MKQWFEKEKHAGVWVYAQAAQTGERPTDMPMVFHQFDGYYATLNDGDYPMIGPIEKLETAQDVALYLKLEVRQRVPLSTDEEKTP